MAIRTPEWLRSEDVDATGREKLNWWRVLFLIVAVFGIVTFIVYLIADMKSDKVDKVPEKITETRREPKITFDAEAEAAEVFEEEKKEEAQEKKKEEKKNEEPDPRIAILAKLGAEPFKPFQMDHDRVGEFQEFAKVSGGRRCDIMPGTIAKLRLDSGVNTDNGGTVTAVLVEPVPGTGGCIALDMGAVFTGVVDTNMRFGQGKANVVFNSISADGEVIAIQAAAGDAVGSGGVPGDVNRHWASKISGVAIATGVDLAGLALSGGGDGFSVLVNNSGSVLDDFSRQFINRPDTITVDPTQEKSIITVTFTQKIST